MSLIDWWILTNVIITINICNILKLSFISRHVHKCFLALIAIFFFFKIIDMAEINKEWREWVFGVLRKCWVSYAYRSSTLHSPRYTLILRGDPQFPSAIRTLSFADMCAMILYIISICKFKDLDTCIRKVMNEKISFKDQDVTSSGAWQRSAISSSVNGSTGSLQLQAQKEGLVYKWSLLSLDKIWQRSGLGLILTWLH